MKKIVFYLPLIALAACGEQVDETATNVEVNSGDQSSVVETTNPQNTQQNNNQNSEAADGEITTIEFLETKFDFGKVFYPSENKHTFKFKNTGNVPLVIKEATASCGCTVPNKPDEPIAPGQIGELDVIFRPKEGQVGQPVSKTITVVANTVPAESYLEISANVLKGM